MTHPKQETIGCLIFESLAKAAIAVDNPSDPAHEKAQKIIDWLFRALQDEDLNVLSTDLKGAIEYFLKHGRIEERAIESTCIALFLLGMSAQETVLAFKERSII